MIHLAPSRSRSHQPTRRSSSSSYWYAVSDEAREYVFVVGQNRPVERTEVADMIERQSIPIPSWVISDAFRLVCDGEDEFEDRIEPTYRDLAGGE